LEEVAKVGDVEPSTGGDRGQSKLVRRLDSATSILGVFTILLQQVARTLRALVLVVGWLTVLISVIDAMVSLNLSPDHFVAFGAGGLAVLQGVIKPGGKSPNADSPPTEDDPSVTETSE
jgi:hypothetical protein